MPSDDELEDHDDLDLHLDELIEDVTVDAYGDEDYWSFLQAFEDDMSFPFTASLVGMPVVVTGIDFDGNDSRGITVTVTHDQTTSTMSILDVELPDHESRARRLVLAYRRWLGIA